MFKNKINEKTNNICGANIKKLRKQLPGNISQRTFAEMLQLQGLDITKNAIQRIESRERFVTDIELRVIANVLNVTCDELLK